MTPSENVSFHRILIIAALMSLIFHILFVLYMPPIEDINFFPFESETPIPEDFKISLQGSIDGGTPGDNADETQEKSTGNFSEFSGVDADKWGDLLSKLEGSTGMAEVFEENYDDVNKNPNVSKSYIQRPRNHEDIVIKDVFPTIHNIDTPFSEILKSASIDLQNHFERNRIITSYRNWKVGRESTATLTVNIDSMVQSNTPLVFPKQKRQKYFDENLKLPKEIQLNNFIREFSQYDPDKGDLPIAMRELYYKNLQRLAYSFSADRSFLFLDYFLENLNKEDFLKNSLHQAAKLSDSKTQTELLFAIENIYLIQQRAWKYYFDYEKMYMSMPDKNKQYLRSETLRRVVENYKKILSTKNIDNYQKIETLYRNKRREILDYIIVHTPDKYRRLDALFELAVVNWEQGDADNDIALMKKSARQWLSIHAQITNEETYTIKQTQTTLKKLAPKLEEFLNKGELLQQLSRQHIRRMLLRRHSARLVKKRQREEKILWQ